MNTLKWSRLPNGPMKKVECGMVSYEDQLILFGGYGIRSGPTQPGAQFVRNSKFAGWTNELHSFNVKKSKEEPMFVQ